MIERWNWFYSVIPLNMLHLLSQSKEIGNRNEFGWIDTKDVTKSLMNLLGKWSPFLLQVPLFLRVHVMVKYCVCKGKQSETS